MNRIKALDYFRGFIIFSMLLVNHPGDWAYVYPLLRHATWHGFTFADLVFPSFLFITGFSAFVSFQKRDKSRKKLLFHIFKRSILLFAFGLILNGFPDYNLNEIRIMGVLQRIAIVYLSISLIYFYDLNIKTVIMALLLLYWLFLKYTIAPDGGSGWETVYSWNGWVDQKILGKHIWKYSPMLDPEGLLSTIPAIASGLIGMEAGKIYIKYLEDKNRLIFIYLVYSTILLLSAFLWKIDFPFNKTIWSSSFTLLTGAVSILLFLFFVVTENKWASGKEYWAVFGINPLAIYITAGLAGRILTRVNFECGVLKKCLSNLIYSNAFSPELNSFIFALLYLQIFFGFFWILYRNKIIIKI